MEKYDLFCLIILLISLFLISTVYVLLIINARTLSKAKIYGQRKREACGNEYLELETARYELFKSYDRTSQRIMRAINVLLLIAIGLPLLASFVVAFNVIPFSKNPGVNSFQKGAFYIAAILWVLSAITYFKFIAKEGSSKKVSNYLSSFNQRFDKNELMRSVKVLTIAVPILIVMGISTYLDPKRNAYSKWHIASFSVATFVMMFIARDRVALQRDVYQKYMDAKSTLQARVLGMRNNPEFRRYLDINIRRAHPSAQGQGLLDEEPYLSELYAYVEHRPGRDSFSSDEGYTTVGFVKSVFKPYIDAPNTNEQQRIELMKLMQLMYVQGETLDTFKLTDLDAILKTLFPLPVGQAASEKSELHSGIYQKIHDEATRENENVSSLSYSTLSTILKAYSQTPTKADGTSLTQSPSGDVKLKVDNLMTYIIYESKYKENVDVSFESIQYYLEMSTLVDETIIADLRNKFDELERSRVATGTLLDFQKALRGTRALEDGAINSTDAHLRNVLWISVMLLALLVYVIVRMSMHFAGPDKTYMIFSGGLLICVFVITWYSWFYAKLKL